jgi:hypothetical protein
MNMDTPENFVEGLDPGLLTYKEELFMRSVTSFTTLKYLRPREVCDMKIPEVYKRLLIDKIISLQSPDTKKVMKRERSPFLPGSGNSERDTTSTVVTDSRKRPKQLKFDTQCDSSCEVLQPQLNLKTTEKNPSTCAKSIGFIENELQRLSEERETLNLLLTHKKDELAALTLTPDIPAPLAIPGNRVAKVICDHCHHKGHKAHGNKGNQSCPYLPCPGYSACGILSKHKERKQEMAEVSTIFHSRHLPYLPVVK